MKQRLPSRICRFAAVWLVVASARADGPALPSSPSAAPASPAVSASPAELLDRACTLLGRRRSIVAKVRHRAVLFDREIIGSGDFAQGPASSRLLRYDLRMQVGERVVGRLQISDGSHLWIVTTFKDEPELERVDVDRVLTAGQGSGTTNPGADLGLGGLSYLLNKLRADFEFKTIFQSQLGELPMIGLEGTWRPEALAKLLPDQAAAVAAGGTYDTTKLKSHLPDRVVLYLGADDMFPYRIEYRRAIDPGKADEAAARMAQHGSRQLLVLELFEVRFDEPMEETLFLFSPGTRKFIDATDAYLQRRAALP